MRSGAVAVAVAQTDSACEGVDGLASKPHSSVVCPATAACDSSSTTILIVLLILALGGVVYYFKVVAPEKMPKGLSFSLGAKPGSLSSELPPPEEGSSIYG